MARKGNGEGGRNPLKIHNLRCTYSTYLGEMRPVRDRTGRFVIILAEPPLFTLRRELAKRTVAVRYVDRYVS